MRSPGWCGHDHDPRARPGRHRHDLRRRCANRVERTLNDLDGVSATVNFAPTERVRVVREPSVSIDDLIVAVRSVGYDAHLPEPEPRADDEQRALGRRLVVAAALTVPVVLLSMVPALEFPGSAWLCLALVTPVVTWAAWPFHRAALANLRHGATTMDTLSRSASRRRTAGPSSHWPVGRT